MSGITESLESAHISVLHRPQTLTNGAREENDQVGVGGKESGQVEKEQDGRRETGTRHGEVRPELPVAVQAQGPGHPVAVRAQGPGHLQHPRLCLGASLSSTRHLAYQGRAHLFPLPLLVLMLSGRQAGGLGGGRAGVAWAWLASWPPEMGESSHME